MALFSEHIYPLHQARAQRLCPSPAPLVTHVAQELQSRAPLQGEILTLSSGALPCASAAFDAIVSCLHLHWVEHLPKLLSHMKQCLRPGGVFLGALWGGHTLYELRESFLEAELELTGGAFPRVSPMLYLADAPRLLGQAGFINNVADSEKLQVMYGSVWELMHHLREMGETNKLQERKKTFTSRALFKKMEAVYQTRFGAPNGQLPATFEVIYLTGWK